MRILLLEENAQKYIEVRNILEKQGLFEMNWAPNYEVAQKMITRSPHDVHLIGYNLTETQEKFITYLHKYVPNIPTIILTSIQDHLNTKWIDKYQSYFLPREHLSYLQLEHTIYYLSTLQDQHKHENIFKSVFNKSCVFTALLDAQGIIIEINPTGLDFIGWKRNAVVKQSLWDMPWITYTKNIKTQFQKALQGKITPCHIEIQQENKKTAILDFMLTPIQNDIAPNEITKVLIEGWYLDSHINQILSHDQLTELPNRHLFLKHLTQAMSHAKKQDEYHIAVLLIELKRFKVINATLGHNMGDWLLMTISQRLQEYAKDKNSIVARASEQAFIILLEDMQDFVEATTVATKINNILSKEVSLQEYEISMSSNIGIAYYTDQEDAEDILRDAEAALHHTRTISKTGCTVFRPDMHHHGISRLQMETDLQQALEQNNFVLYYQPQIDLNSDKLVGMESLIRFQHPEYGLVSPLEFIPVLEETGNILPIGKWILNTACQQLTTLLQNDLIIDHVTVNISAHQFRNKHFIRDIIGILKDAGLQADSLELEITEHLLLEDTDFAIKKLKYLKNMGVRITIDDFGTGYASFNYLKRFPVDFLKIDNSFIGGIISSAEDTAITAATIDMAHALGLGVIAEGVETQEQHNFLREMGCDFVQGYLYAPPMKDIHFLEWSKEYNQKQHPPR
ncbi:MAG: GGDEF domain-containing protein [Thiomargarita sp.]|nr:GGDEF domain-containing protein [Thiomargarita sp.]